MAKRRRSLFQSVRSRIIVGGSIWIILLTVLGTYGVTLTFAEGFRLRDVRILNEGVYSPAEKLVTALQRERYLSVQFVGARNSGGRGALEDQRSETNAAVDDFRRSVGNADVQDRADAPLKSAIDAMLTRTNEINAARTAIAGNDLSRTRTAAVYDRIIDTAAQIYNALPSANESHIGAQHKTVVNLQRAREVLARESALLAGALAAGDLSTAEQQAFARTVGTRRFLLGDLSNGLESDQRDKYRQLTGGDPLRELEDLENDVAEYQVPNPDATTPDGTTPNGTGSDNTPPSPPVSASDWDSTTTEALADMRAVELAFVGHMLNHSDDEADSLILRGTLIIVGGLLVVLLLVTVWLLVAPRYVTRQLFGLKRAALQLADERLPRVVEQLRRGERVDVHTAAPPLEFGQDEFGQVGHAFNRVQEVAVRAAIEQTELRSGIRDVFVNLARRSQGLVHRQLSLLDEMERRTSDPDELERLFAIDHLATRMRRHAEDLIILSGSTPGRQWRKPVPLVDVVRGAVGEIDAYARVTVLPVAEAHLSGRVVADVIHLLAELLENAAVYSPPQTKVRVSGELVPNGFVVEIEDSGLGMSDEDLARFNERLVTPPEFNPSDTVQLGLFVVARLAQRHGIRVHLRGSPYGGTTAIVLLPGNLVETRDALPSGNAAVGALTAGPAETVRSVSGGPYRASSDTDGDPDPTRRPDPTGRPELPSRAEWRSHRADQAAAAASQAREFEAGHHSGTPESPAETDLRSPVGSNDSTDSPNGFTDSSGESDSSDSPSYAAAHSFTESRGHTEPPSLFESRHGALPTVQEEPPVPEGPPTSSGLPRRVRQASLANELRETTPSTSTRQPADRPASARTPEQIRAMMTTFQRGSLRGRTDVQATDPAPKAPNHRPSPRPSTTSRDEDS